MRCGFPTFAADEGEVSGPMLSLRVLLVPSPVSPPGLREVQVRVLRVAQALRPDLRLGLGNRRGNR
jgi:hypothetical protein